ncbi:hypothetical protein M2163_000492 [Streptomyces sp. SAI-135]|jgi:hypothetical protein|uniref:hypothetical protein n=1 Tax=unclassified Streptomyces TaxID=2593676 RepID=UPI002473B5FD|nr:MULTISPECIES: hypothetical protein [unclassified Streptomyces]MDH6523003.1 hypothetical protein [Streptomyces sp. SAI-090]MDH6573886.1 hypothetical protein [Streptomyces sp. SAI-117]MDH6581378.1 hypothetical protein [Streptomyces sp. SAI-133]MDH6613384.1 hypothetical protein [Streptomyces sp. SAI-135]
MTSTTGGSPRHRDDFCAGDLRAPIVHAASENRRMDVRQLEYFRIPSITCR